MLADRPRRLDLPLFFLLCLALSWAIWLPRAIATLGGGKPTAGGNPLDALAVWSPGIVAALLSRLLGGKAGSAALWGQLGRWRVGVGWYLVALLYPAALWLAARGADAVLGRSYPLTLMPILRHFPPEQAFMVPVAFIFTLPNTLAEELGWRGFALPRLQRTRTALVASVLLGLFWGLWHLPMWVGFGMAAVPLGITFLGTVRDAILFTWVYNSTGGSLVPVWLLHFAMTATYYCLPRIPTHTDDVLGWIVVGAVVLGAGAERLTRHAET